MGILKAFVLLIFGLFFLWMGALQLITSMLPPDFAVKVAEIHGRWVRVNVFGLPPISQTSKPGGEE